MNLLALFPPLNKFKYIEPFICKAKSSNFFVKSSLLLSGKKTLAYIVAHYFENKTFVISYFYKLKLFCLPGEKIQNSIDKDKKKTINTLRKDTKIQNPFKKRVSWNWSPILKSNTVNSCLVPRFISVHSIENDHCFAFVVNLKSFKYAKSKNNPNPSHPKTSLIVPDFTISAYSSSCNSLNFGLFIISVYISSCNSLYFGLLIISVNTSSYNSLYFGLLIISVYSSSCNSLYFCLLIISFLSLSSS